MKVWKRPVPHATSSRRMEEGSLDVNIRVKFFSKEGFQGWVSNFMDFKVAVGKRRH
jgi:hypothetical protein